VLKAVSIVECSFQDKKLMLMSRIVWRDLIFVFIANCQYQITRGINIELGVKQELKHARNAENQL